jgi:hypothetical protein
MNEQVNHPSHYAEGRKYEPIDVIQDWKLDFCLGNTVKYISRCGRKNSRCGRRDCRYRKTGQLYFGKRDQCWLCLYGK